MIPMTPERRPSLQALGAFLRVGARLVVLGCALTVSGCIIVPVPSVTPDHQSGIIDDDTLESLIGLDEEEVSARIGWPDYSGNLGDSYVMVYQGEKRYSTDIYAAVSGGYTGAVGKIGSGTSTTLYCYVIELDENRKVVDYDIDARPSTGISKREGSNNPIEPAADCSQAVWGAGGQKQP